MSANRIGPHEVTAFVAKQLKAVEALEGTAALELETVSPLHNAIFHLPADTIEETSRHIVQDLRKWAERSPDLAAVDGALAEVELSALLIPTDETVQTIASMAQLLTNSVPLERESLDDVIEQAGVQVSEPTRQVLAELLFAQAKPKVLQTLLTDLSSAQPYLDQLRDSSIHPDLFTREEASIYRDAAVTHAAEALQATLPLLRALPADEKRGVREVLGSDGSFFRSLSPGVGAQLLAALAFTP